MADICRLFPPKIVDNWPHTGSAISVYPLYREKPVRGWILSPPGKRSYVFRMLIDTSMENVLYLDHDQASIFARSVVFPEFEHLRYDYDDNFSVDAILKHKEELDHTKRRNNAHLLILCDEIPIEEQVLLTLEQLYQQPGISVVTCWSDLGDIPPGIIENHNFSIVRNTKQVGYAIDDSSTHGEIYFEDYPRVADFTINSWQHNGAGEKNRLSSLYTILDSEY